MRSERSSNLWVSGFLLYTRLTAPRNKMLTPNCCNELIHSYRNRPELVFTSSDSKHRIYALPQE